MRAATVTLRIGLTGGIGSGKSAVANAFSSRGVPIVDTDVIAHELSGRNAPGQRAVAEAFGPRSIAPDGSLDRGWLRDRAFADADFRSRLEGILHPLIAAEAARRMAQWSPPYGIVVVPLLLERGGMARSVDRVLVVDCPEDVQVARVMTRSGLSEAAVRAIMAAQLTRTDRLARADDVIDNGGPREAIEPQVDALDSKYRLLAAGDTRP
jgi:dephospho-CoA kinase